jgi:ketosteroid isomerase-like protein
VVNGREAISAALDRFAALKPRMQGEITNVLTAGDVALVTNRWQLEGTQPDGAPVEMEGHSADVLRRRPDGGWRIVIDNPWGGSA